MLVASEREYNATVRLQPGVHHINDGAMLHGKSKGGGFAAFFQELRGKLK